MTLSLTQTVQLWFAKNGRNLPWRGTHDPYLIWVSEIILQQTRVKQGYPFFMHFVERFPNVQALAEASEDEVLHYWQGLGYYSRARNMHAAAQQIAAEGEFPKTYDAVRTLKGVGDYTAAAICSLANNQPYAVVDGNVYRVLSRYFAIDMPVDTAKGKTFFSQLAQEQLDTRHPANHNQALMDFGALQCTPISPRCADCPLAGGCQALAEHRVDELPVKSHVTKVRVRHFTFLYIHDTSHTLLARRAAGDIWQGLYQPPLIESPEALSDTELIQLPQLASFLADGSSTLTLLYRGLRHQLTHQLLQVDFWNLDVGSLNRILPEWLNGYKAVPVDDLGAYAVPTLIARLWDMLPENMKK